MSILDLPFDSPEKLNQAVKETGPMLDQILAETGLADDEILQSLREGISPHIAYGLDDEHLDALFATGINFMQTGDVQKAQNVFLKLNTLKSMESRYNYALGTTFQAQGEFAAAAKIYMIALALDATHVDGYLRVGECLLAVKEFDKALEAFEAAQSLSEHGHATPQAQELATRMVEHTRSMVESQN